MVARSVKATPGVSPALQRARVDISGSLVQALRDVGASIASAARWMGVHERTVRLWIKGERPVNVERVVSVRKLDAPFRRRFCVHDHAAHDSMPYIARRHPGVTSKHGAKTRRSRA